MRMKKNPRESYLFPVIFVLVWLVPLLVIYGLYETGYIDMEKAISLLDGTGNIHYLIGGGIAAIFILGSAIKAGQLMVKKDGKHFAQKLIIIFLAFLAIFLRFNRYFDWF